MRRWRDWRLTSASILGTLILITSTAIGLAPQAAAHRSAPKAQVKATVQYPQYYDGNVTTTVDHSAHPDDPPNTYRVYYHFDACEQFKAVPSVRTSLSDPELVADGLLPRNAFATIEDWDRAVLNVTTRVCDSYTLYNVGTDTPAFINGAPTINTRQSHNPLDPPNSDCFCYKPESQPNYAGFVGDGSYFGQQHDAQYGYTWVPDLTAGPGPIPSPGVTSDSSWVGGSGLFTINGSKEVLNQTGVQDWWTGASSVQSHRPFWECVNPNSKSYPCDQAHFYDTKTNSTYIGDEMLMYTASNFYWGEDITQNFVSDTTIGPTPLLDSSEWITETPADGQCGGCNFPLADFGNTGIANMKWLNSTDNTFYDAGSDDSDYLTYTMAIPPDDPPTDIETLAKDGTTSPYYINAFWGVGLSVWWQQYT